MTTAELQLIAQIQYGTSGTVWHVGAGGNDTTGDGLSWATRYATASKAASVALTGDVIVVLTSITDNGVINLQRGANQGVSLIGGIGSRPSITSNLTGTGIIVPGHGTVIRNIVGINTADDLSYLIGILSSEGSIGSSNVLIENCRFQADSDIIWTNVNTHANWIVRNCSFTSKWDSVLLGGTNIVFENCDFRQTGDSLSAGGGIVARGIVITTGFTFIRNCRFRVFGASGTNHAVTIQVSATGYIERCQFHTSGTNAYDVRTTSSGTIYLDGVNAGSGTYGVPTQLVTSGSINSRPGVIPINTANGSRSITITVNDGTTAIQGALVRIFLNAGNNQVGTTDASGIVSFSSAGDGTYAVSISAPGYSFAPTTLVVDGTETATYSMTQIVPTASTTGFVTGYATCYDKDGLPAEGVEVGIAAFKSYTLPAGVIVDDAVRTETSDSDGLVEFTNLLPGWTYKLTTSNKTVTRAIPTTAVDTYQFPSFVG